MHDAILCVVLCMGIITHAYHLGVFSHVRDRVALLILTTLDAT